MSKLFFSKSKILQTFGTLHGLIDGISSDGKILPKEVEALQNWVNEHDQVIIRPPFTEIIQIIKEALSDMIITESELKDIRFVCNKVLSSFENISSNTTQIQKLHGIASGIAADGDLHTDEWVFLQNWLIENSKLKGSWPYDEIEALIVKHRSAEDLSLVEREIILHYLKDFCGFNSNSALSHPLNEPGSAITGICAVCPEVEFTGKTFCLTGRTKKMNRNEIVERIVNLGGYYKDDISNKTDYLIVGSEGSPIWTYSCYGRKVEHAINLRKNGHKVLIIHEFDFWDSLEDAA